MSEPSNEAVVAALKAAFSRTIPPGHAIAVRAVASALGEHDDDIGWIKANFSALVEGVQIAAYEEYLEAEKQSGAQALAETFLPIIGENASPRDVIGFIGRHFYALDRFFLGLTQGRRPRAGKVFEFLIRELFIRLHYPFAAQPVINGQPDFVLPSLEHFRRHAPDCIIFTVKRTLRERWRQIVTEGTRGLGFYLATIDEDISERDLAEMLRSRITLVVPERVKDVRSVYGAAPNVIVFESFFRFHLDPAMERWRASGAVAGVA